MTMKKLAVMAAVMGLGFAGRAVPSVNMTFSVSSTSPIYDGTSSGLIGAGYSVYFISSTQWAPTYISQSAFLNNLQNNGGNVAAAAGNALIRDASTKSTTTSGSGLINSMTVSPLNENNIYIDASDYEDCSSFAVFMAVVGDDGVFISSSNSDNPYLTSNLVLSGDGSQIWRDETGKGGYSGSGWYTINFTEDVPEPTSGLLMLLGLAGLALKRKRA